MPDTSAGPQLILASRSPRRRQLLREAGYRFEVVVPRETAEQGPPPKNETPAETVARLAQQKAADVANRVSHGIIVGCDTVAECDGQVLGKPVDENHARQMLHTLRGRQHRVLSGLCVWPCPGGLPDIRVDVTTLRMDPIPDEELEDYLAGKAWVGKAGAFGYQDRLGWVHVIKGSESNVVGLPMELLARMLKEISDAPAHRPHIVQ